MMDEEKFLKIRLIVSTCLFALLCVLYFTITMPLALNYVLFILLYLFISYDVLIKGFKHIIKGKIFDETFLMALATISAFIIQQFPEAIAIMLFYQIGEYFQDMAVEHSRKSILALENVMPTSANAIRNNKQIKIAAKDVRVGDILVIKPYEKIPVDGVIIDGETYIDTSPLTGESVPKFYKSNSEVLAGCINQANSITIKCTKEFQNSAISKILDLVENSALKKSKSEKFITKFAQIYTPAIVGFAFLLFLIPSLITGNFAIWAYRAIAFLVVSCPCALVLSIPLSFFAGIGKASKNGILIKGSTYIEKLAKAKTFVFDKTGTLTSGKFEVVDVFPKENKEEILKLASIAEKQSNHPIAKSILKAYSGSKIPTYQTTEIAGKGIIATKDDQTIIVGNYEMLKFKNIKAKKQNTIGTTIYVAKNNQFMGFITIADKPKDEAKAVINALNSENIKTVMLTGDDKDSAKKIASTVGIDKFFAELMPEDKLKNLEKILEETQKNETVCYVGDGINDSPVLVRSDVGISMGKMGSDVAVEASDIVVINDNLNDILKARKIAKKTMSIAKQNIIFSIGIKFLILLLSAFGITSLWFAIFADVGVTILAILNSMRLLK